MSPLNIHPEEVMSAPKKKKSKALKVMLGLAALVLVPVIGTTFAATININGATTTNVQFAQGSVDTAGCDTRIDTAATSIYSTGFKIKEIILSDVDVAACKGKTFTVSIADGTTEATLITSGTIKQLSFKIPATHSSGNVTLTSFSPSTGFTPTITAEDGTTPLTELTTEDGVIKIVIGTPILASEDVDKILLQTS
jgi:hypothetical protein